MVTEYMPMGAAGRWLGLMLMAFSCNAWTQDQTAELSRGDYLVNQVLGCLHCHSERDWNVLGAPPLEPLGAGRDCSKRTGLPGVAGQGELPAGLCFPNITADVETGIGTWSGEDIVTAMRQGLRPDGGALFPIMPWLIYRDVADSDADAVAAYIRTLKAVERVQPGRRQVLEARYREAMAAGGEPPPASPPDESDELAKGEYLARIARCGFCHTPRDAENRPREDRFWAGGGRFQNAAGEIRSSNLTPHPDGIGEMSRDDFIALVRLRGDGRAADPGTNSVMPWVAYAGMTDADLGAIWRFLNSLPALPDEREF